MITHLQDAVFHLRQGIKALNRAAEQAPSRPFAEALNRLARRVGKQIADIREAEDIARKEPVT